MKDGQLHVFVGGGEMGTFLYGWWECKMGGHIRKQADISSRSQNHRYHRLNRSMLGPMIKRSVEIMQKSATLMSVAALYIIIVRKLGQPCCGLS